MGHRAKVLGEIYIDRFIWVARVNVIERFASSVPARRYGWKCFEHSSFKLGLVMDDQTCIRLKVVEHTVDDSARPADEVIICCGLDVDYLRSDESMVILAFYPEHPLFCPLKLRRVGGEFEFGIESSLA